MGAKYEVFMTTNIDLASALVALHFKLRQYQPITRVYEGVRQSDTFYFQRKTENPDFGVITVKQVAKVWDGGEIENKPLQSHVDHMRNAFRNRVLMVDCIKTKVRPMIHSKVDGRDVFLPLDASPELRRKMQRMIEETA